MRFSVVNLGCKVNRVESDQFCADLVSRGCTQADFDPEMVIVNTCTVTGDAAKKTRKAVRQQLKSHPCAIVIVTGCAAVIDGDDFLAMSDRVRVVPKNSVVDFVCTKQPAAPALRTGSAYPTRAGIKIQDGCNNACTYCIVHVARGRSYSIDAESILNEAEAMAQGGVAEVVLTGINLGTYCDSGFDLAGLTDEILQRCPSLRVRISSIEPKNVDDSLIGLLESRQGRVCRHLHLPLQSGSSQVLRQMARPYNADYYKALVDRLYQHIPQLSLSTDIIVGFPGETEQDFRQTLETVRYCRFTKVHVFRYSKRQGTPAAARTDQIDPQIVAYRAAELARVAAEVRDREAVARVGTREFAVVESSGIATTESHFTGKVEDEAETGRLIPVILQDYLGEGEFIYGR